MIRRVNGRSPPFAYVGFILVILILGFNYWTLSTQNNDLQETVENLQSVVKIRYFIYFIIFVLIETLKELIVT